MKLLTAQQIREWDQFTIKHEPIASIDLMERAAQAFVHHYTLRHTIDNPVFVFCGNGNNGGDGLAIARMLYQKGYRVNVYLIAQQGSADLNTNLQRLDEDADVAVSLINEKQLLPELRYGDVIIDALFGTGLSRPIEGRIAELIHHLNESSAYRISVDVPSGLQADLLPVTPGQVVFQAHETYTFQVPKLSFLLADSGKYCGEISVLDIGLAVDYTSQVATPFHYADQTFIKQILRKRNKFSHKGTYGHVLLAGGSFGKMGAACLMAKAALRTGCGLATAYIPKTGYSILQTAVPECMVINDDELFELRHLPDVRAYEAVAVGPGMGQHEFTIKAFEHWIRNVSVPLVIDADALNICARLLTEHHFSFRFPTNAILTPHPKEFDRLAGISINSLERLEKQIHFAKKHEVIVILKGAHTSIALPDGRVYFNSTGNAAMATAGSGDVLTGIIASLLAQGYTAEQAAVAGVYVHGLAGDLTARNRATLLASDIIEAIPQALHISTPQW
jgi:NAD(P)H-hydrate epimerase